MSWEKVRLGDIANFSNGINFSKDSYGAGVKLIGVSDFGNKLYPDYESLNEIKREVVKSSDYLKDGDIIFVRSNGNKELVGRCMLIAGTSEHVTYSGFCIRARLIRQDCYDPLFFTYHFKNNQFRRSIAGTAVGANIQNLSQGKLANYEAIKPNFINQQRIASILSAYDELIENNQKQIKLLEEAAQRLYKEWFIDLRFPGHENVKVVDGVPEGWTVAKVCDFGSVITGKTPSTTVSDNFGDDIPFVKIPDMHGTMFSVETEQKLSVKGAETQKSKYVPKNSLMVSCIGTVGLVNISVSKCQTNQQINSIILENQDFLYYLYFVMKDMQSLLDGLGSSGATMANVNKEKFSNMRIIKPDNVIMSKYYTYVAPMFEKCLVLQKGIKALKEARDRLLPKLMSGEIEV